MIASIKIKIQRIGVHEKKITGREREDCVRFVASQFGIKGSALGV
jgi:hypothetical protein